MTNWKAEFSASFQTAAARPPDPAATPTAAPACARSRVTGAAKACPGAVVVTRAAAASIHDTTSIEPSGAAAARGSTGLLSPAEMVVGAVTPPEAPRLVTASMRVLHEPSSVCQATTASPAPSRATSGVRNVPVAPETVRAAVHAPDGPAVASRTRVCAVEVPLVQATTASPAASTPADAFHSAAPVSTTCGADHPPPGVNRTASIATPAPPAFGSEEATCQATTARPPAPTPRSARAASCADGDRTIGLPSPVRVPVTA